MSDLDAYGDDDDTDAKLNRYVAEQVDVCLSTLPVDLRAAVGIRLRNKDVPNQVFRNPRCSPEEQHLRYQKAKDPLLPMLRKRDVIRLLREGLHTLYALTKIHPSGRRSSIGNEASA